MPCERQPEVQNQNRVQTIRAGTTRDAYDGSRREQELAMFYHIDTDMGVDDGLALVVADMILPHICAVSTVVGNVSLETATRNALIFRKLLDRTQEWRVIRGAERATGGFRSDAAHIHGADGLGGATSLLDETLKEELSHIPVSALKEAPAPSVEAVTVIGIGPATNIPRLVSWYGRKTIRRIILMSGVFFDAGNITPFAEFNAYSDPAALQMTLDLGIPVLIVPLDLCRKVQLSLRLFSSGGDVEASQLAQLVKYSHLRYADSCHVAEGVDGCFPDDAVAVLAAAEPHRFHKLRGHVTVECDGARRGQTTIALDDTSHVEVATGGDLKWVRTVIADVLSKIR